MKIEALHIKEYQQFKDLELDFTYPKGHEKAGKPLEKVCFIGQSGTGKTTLLDLISEFISDENFNFSHNRTEINLKSNALSLKNFKNIRLYFNKPIPKNKSYKPLVIYYNAEINVSNLTKTILQNNELTKEILLILNKRINSPISDESRKIQFKKNENVEEFDLDLKKVRNYVKIKNDEYSQFIWAYLLRKIDYYDGKLKAKGSDLINRGNFTNIEKFKDEIESWKKKYPNPRVDLAEKCLNPILNKFFLEVDVENVENPITIKLLNKDLIIPNEKISTGTKHIIVTALPLYFFDTRESIILFDEPERSLFPDLQRDLIQYYTSLAPNAQFFFATHSPIIASAFEPCERFILYFDEKGNVKYRNGTAPQGDDPNDILAQDFEISNLMLDYGIEKHKEYLELKTKIRNEKDPNKKEELLRQKMKLGDAYNF